MFEGVVIRNWVEEREICAWIFFACQFFGFYTVTILRKKELNKNLELIQK